MSNIEKVREVMRDLNRLGDIGDTVTIGHEHLLALADSLRDAIPMAPQDARPGEFYRVRVLDNPSTEFIGTRPANGVVGAVDDGAQFTWNWSIFGGDGLQSVADDGEIELISGRKLDMKTL